jgi:hypothetical protein
MPHDRRPLGRRQQIFDAVVNHLDRSIGLAARIAAWHASIDGSPFAKPATGFRLHHTDALGRQLQQHHERLVHAARALERSADGHFAVARHRDHPISLYVGCS